jgi:hypothetical protein
MLLSSISSSISPDPISSALLYYISAGLPPYSGKTVIVLIVLVSLKDVLSPSKKWNKYLNNSLNLAIVPLVFCFVAIVAYKILENI